MKLTVANLAEILNGEVVGNNETVVNSISKIEEAIEGDITFLSNPKYVPWLKKTKASAVIVSNEFKEDNKFNYLKSGDAYMAYAILSKIFNKELEPFSPSIHESAVISEKSSIGENVVIGPNVVIGSNCIIEDDVTIHANCSIVKNVLIASNSLIHPGCVLGSDGFGFAPSK